MLKKLAVNFYCKLIIYKNKCHNKDQLLLLSGVVGTNRTTVLCFRYLGYMCDLLADKPYRPHFKPLTIKSITVSPVPFFNKQRNGCRPYCDVLIGETKIYTTCADFERMK